ncbi:hypothetical protein TWF730_004354 [Orbilia blumenaviensis]|uniref:C2H2-type domain-containing protein n=1 Tax=Orbilia blumenaviensis TaxID=1796055 RepID=A0AAV9U498_9PEZI
MDEATKISRIAILCKQTFADCVSNPELGSQAWIRSAQGDFNLWCVGIKATSSNKSSLEYRLRDRLDVREDICDLLQGLVDVLQKCQQSVIASPGLTLISIELVAIGDRVQLADSRSASPDNFESWEAMSNESGALDSPFGDEVSDPTLSENIYYIKDILSQLWRISRAIRESANKYRFAKADDSLNEDDFEDYRQHLTAIILSAFEDQEAAGLTPAERMRRALGYDRLTQVQKRIIRLNILGKNRIQFVARSQNTKARLEAASQRSESTPLIKDLEHPNIGSNNEHMVHQPELSSIAPTPSRIAAEGSTRSDALNTGITATEVDSRLNIEVASTEETVSGTTEVMKIALSQSHPCCPSLNPDGSLVCPYCDDLLPPNFAKSENEKDWRTHVAQDIIPYSCIIDDCDTPDEMYATAENLLSHMLKKHSVTRWACDHCSYGTNEKEPARKSPQYFDTSQEWESHAATEHKDMIPVEQRAIFAELGKRPTIGPLSCPLCQFATESPDTRINDHILQHLHEFSLWALPDNAEERRTQRKLSRGAFGIQKWDKVKDI